MGELVICGAEKGRKRVLLLWHTINENFGDVLIYYTVKDFLEKKGCICSYMDVGKPCIEVIREANTYDFLLFAGGGIIERYVPNVIRYFDEDFKELKVPYGIIGLSVGNFDYSEYSKSIGCWIQNASFFYTRDEYSAKKLNQIVKTNKVVSGVDVVWSNKKINCRINKGLENIGINVRNIPYLDMVPDFNWRMINDSVYNNDVSIQIPDESQIIIEGLKQYTYSVDEVIRQIARCKYLIAMRYHVVLAAAMMGIPTIPIVYCNKVRELSMQLNLSEYEVDLLQLEKLDFNMDKMKKNYDIVKNSIIEKTKEMKKCSLSILENIADVIVAC